MESGCPQDSKFVWVDLFSGHSIYSKEKPNWQLRKSDDEDAMFVVKKQRDWCAAFLPEELGEIMLAYLKRSAINK